jgi:hypothetical protein
MFPRVSEGRAGSPCLVNWVAPDWSACWFALFSRLAAVRELVGIGGVVAALSVASDLTRGHPPGEAMRACLLATELARRAGLDRVRQGEVYYGTLLRFAGCAATSHEIAAAFGGDDIAVRARGDLIDPTVLAEATQFLAGLGADAGRLRVLGGVEGVSRLKAEGARADCEVGAVLAGCLRLPEAVGPAVLDAFERFDGCGVPAGRAGDEVAEAARFAAVGYAAVMLDAVGGAAVAAGTVARWSGRALDPAIAAIFLDAPSELLRISGPDDLQAAVVEAEPEPRRVFRDEAALDEALAGFGDAVVRAADRQDGSRELLPRSCRQHRDHGVHPVQLRRRTRRCPPARPMDVPGHHHRPAGIDDHASLLAPPRRQDRALPRQRRHRADRPGPDPRPDADPEFISRT